ncbi:septum formation family protein [Salinibacterium sp. SYSU T00001]|uniref:septum formation family protein n=1 Tax=Homoserinimonas sedimenticola TaxID=2986805 RepID=UPI002236BE69|nr:septum formation family protein [Salinibacterium sedimenticola]MCW4385552.1 septum formation family protein [Salinibacterium sedimenticola]
MGWRDGTHADEGGLDDLFGDDKFREYDDNINPFIAPPTAPVPLVEPPARGEPTERVEPVEAPASWRETTAASHPPLPPEEPRGPVHDRFSPTVAMPVPPQPHTLASSPADVATVAMPMAGADATPPTSVLPPGTLPGSAAGAMPTVALHAPQVPTATAAASAAPPSSGVWSRLGTSQRVLVGVAGGALLAVMLVGLYTFGTTLRGPADAATAAAGGTDAAASVALEPGVHPWSALQGGECLDPLDTVWADEFTVVDCAEPHAAQLMHRGEVGPEVTVYLDAEGWQGLTTTLCDAGELLDFDAASAYTDLQWQITYAGDATEWANGDRSYACFLSRASGEPIAESLLAVR